MFLATFRFFVFLGVSLAVYYVLPGKFRPVWLLAASTGFYILAGTAYTIVYPVITILSVWRGTRRIEKNRKDPAACRRTFHVVLWLNVGILAALKYTNFLLRNLFLVLHLTGSSAPAPVTAWRASLGVSFYTLQALSYLIDVYWGTVQADDSLVHVALFTSWFPQMSSGPISRWKQLSPQLYTPHAFNWDRFCGGLMRMLTGLAKKLVLAENLGIYVNALFDGEQVYNGWMIWAGMIAYLVQLYADFSGCMDLVLGAAQCFGIEMAENFDRPFHSRSIQEFWKRWHITLGAWAQDYIMFPILHSRCWNRMRKTLRKRFGKEFSRTFPSYLAMLILWLFIGIWHGGDWRYVMEMVWFWLVIMCGQIFASSLSVIKKKCGIREDGRGWQYFQSVRTALIFMTGVTLFRARSTSEGIRRILRAVRPRYLSVSHTASQIRTFLSGFGTVDLKKSAVCIAFGLTVLLFESHLHSRGSSMPAWLGKRRLVIRWLLLYALIFGVLLFGVYGPGYVASDFIYGGF